MILVTGGAGFIGSNITAALAARGAEIVICDRLRDGDKWRNIAKHELADIIHPDGLMPWLKANGARVSHVIHMGAISATTETDVDKILANNVRLSLDLWQWCARVGVPFLYASSAATYGDGSLGFDDERRVLAYADLRPLNAYGWSKLMFDRRVARIIDDGGPAPPQWVGLKFFNVYGPNEYHKGAMQSVVAKNFSAARAGEAVRLFKSYHPDYRDGGQKRDFIYVRDCVEAVLWLIDHPRVSGIFNLGSGAARSFEDLARAMFAALGCSVKIDFIDMPPDLRVKYQYFTQADMTRLRAEGYSLPLTTLEDGVRDYVQTYLLSADPYR